MTPAERVRMKHAHHQLAQASFLLPGEIQMITATELIGAVRYTPLLLGSLITLEAQTNSITITNAHTAEAIVTFQVSRGKVSESS